MNQVPETADAAIRTNQLICVALVLGQLLFGVVIAIVHALGGLGEHILSGDAERLFAPIGIGVGVLSVPMAFFLRMAVWRGGARGSAAVVIQSFLAGNLAFHAMIEGASLLNLTFWLITGDAIPYVPVAAVLFVIGLTAIPRRSQASVRVEAGSE